MWKHLSFGESDVFSVHFLVSASDGWVMSYPEVATMGIACSHNLLQLGVLELPLH